MMGKVRDLQVYIEVLKVADKRLGHVDKANCGKHKHDWPISKPTVDSIYKSWQ